MRLRLGLWALLILLSVTFAAAQVNGPVIASASSVTGAAPAVVVKNAPFSADEVRLYDRGLDNAAHIHRETHGKIFRDSQGRLRTETEYPSTLPNGERLMYITINDPVQHVLINLNPKTKTAMVFHLSAPVAASVSPSSVGTSPSMPVAQAGRKLTADGTNPPPAAIATKPVEAKTEALGTKYLEGLKVSGTRTARTLNTSAVRTDKPILMVTESWYSPELKMPVLTESDDGQLGHSISKMTNIVRTEPAARLFQVPPDYTVKDTTPATANVKH